VSASVEKADFHIALDESATRYIGKVICVGTIYGWGWTGEQPKSFEIRLSDLFRDEVGSLRGGMGEICTKDHACQGWWAVFSLRHAGHWNFESNRGHYNVCLYRKRPIDAASSVARGGCPDSPEAPSTSGYAIIGLPFSRAERWANTKERIRFEILFTLLIAPAMAAKMIVRPRGFLAQAASTNIALMAVVLPRLVVALSFWGALGYGIWMLLPK
jgi:hypothetical protein